MNDAKRTRLIALRITVAVLIVLWAAFIFGFSGQTGGESGGLSAKVADVLVSTADFFTGNATEGPARAAAIEALQFPIRKAAHMSEYAVLALLVLAQLRLWPTFSGMGKQSAAPPAGSPMTGDGDNVSFSEGAAARNAREPLAAAAAAASTTADVPTAAGAPAAAATPAAIAAAGAPAAAATSAAATAPNTADAPTAAGAKGPFTFATPAAAYLRTLRRSALVAWGAATLYATTDEFHQLFVPGRAGLPTDVLIDATGAALGLLIICSLMAAFHRPR